MRNKNTHSLLKRLAGGAAITAMLMAMVPMSHAATITGAGLTTTDGQNIVGQTVEYTITFNPPGNLNDNDTIDFTFPAGFDISGASATATNTGGEITASSSGVAAQVLTVTLDTVTAPFTDLVTVVIAGVVTPNVATIGTITIDTPVDTGTVAVNVGLNASVALSSTTPSATNVTYTFTVLGLPALDQDDVIRFTFPNGTPVAASNIDITGATDNVTAGLTGTVTDTVVTSGGNYIDLTLDAAATVAGGTTAFTVEFSSIDNPSGSGIHGIGIDVFDEGTTALAQGMANAGVGNSVEITAIVTEALIMTLSGNAVALQVDPAVNSGQDLTESTEINVYNNATGGYSVQARLDDGAGAARLVDGSGNEIGSNSNAAATNNDNYLGYTATNNDTPDATNAENAFAATATTLFTGAGSGDVGAANPTDPDVVDGNPANDGKHTVNYDLNVSFLTPAGVYTGTIYYTVVANF